MEGSADQTQSIFGLGQVQDQIPEKNLNAE